MSTHENIKVESTHQGLLLIDAQEVARRLGLSERTVWRLTAAGKLPNPISIGDKSKRWRAKEIRSWVAAGCPERSVWEARVDKATA
jgi:predicted DNA-binding transcriptional regulator AlpA